MKVLLTGFEPFGGERVNPSYEAIKNMPDIIENIQIVKAEIPTVFKKSIQVLEEKIIEHNPDIVICVGQAGGRFEISIERIAINADDARIPDNEGNQPIDEKIFSDGDAAYFSKLPIKAIAEEIKKFGIPAAVSNTAGTFVCNHVMYGLLYLIDKKYANIKGGFIHVPFIPQQVINKFNTPYMSLEQITQALIIAVKASVNYEEDIKITQGKIC
ncbi:pyroglutamyl-peptidase [Caloramator quimbayensis]|uniref:Pyrrolidone-carboxylate peptidase n=1 Tax=Caloramator quimbayensis TaxID=1147123 RepID=A0A1T4XWN8_9CLOT|nr:pyroglutamyl-peptidase I [Caloramator quimbayensis]SKA93957.1 pyroglutamyl-peptidase [Caloramator quimbayensis]